MKHQGPNLSGAMRQEYIRRYREAHDLRLVQDNNCPAPRRSKCVAIQGIRTIYGHDDQGGPPDAA